MNLTNQEESFLLENDDFYYFGGTYTNGYLRDDPYQKLVFHGLYEKNESGYYVITQKGLDYRKTLLSLN